MKWIFKIKKPKITSLNHQNFCKINKYINLYISMNLPCWNLVYTTMEWVFFVLYENITPIFCDEKVPCCSWLSRQSNTLKVSSSSLGGAKLLFRFTHQCQTMGELNRRLSCIARDFLSLLSIAFIVLWLYLNSMVSFIVFWLYLNSTVGIQHIIITKECECKLIPSPWMNTVQSRERLWKL